MKLFQSACAKLILTIFLLFANGLFSQTEWTALDGPEGGKITAIQIDAANPNVILIGTDGGGVFQSFNGGTDWYPKNQGLTNLHVHSLVLLPSDPTTLYCGTENGVFQSVDFGESWTVGFFDSLQINAIQFHPTKTEYVFLATNAGIFRSHDYGENWTLLTNRIPLGEIHAILMHANDENTILVGVVFVY